MQDNELLKYGPKRDDAKRQEKESFSRLTTVFSTDEFVIRPESEEDAGIDASIELVGSNYTNRRFNVQLKSKSNKKFLKKDGRTISKRIESKTLSYLLQSQLLGIFVLYIQETKTYYFEWAKDLAKAAEKRQGKLWWKKKRISLHFKRSLDSEAVQEIARKINRYASYLKHIESGLQIDDLAESFHDPYDPKNYTDIEWSLTKLISTFEGLIVLPVHLLVQLPPFSKATDSNSYYNSYRSTLYTDNDELYSFFEKLNPKDSQIVSNDSAININQKNLKSILIFFEYNSIHHISPSENRRYGERVCIHNLYIHQGCDCEKCSYPRMQWSNVIKRINTPFDEESSFEWTRRGYMLLELGKIKEAYELYTRLAEYSKENHKNVSYIIAKVNLASMLPFVKSPFYMGGTKEMELAIKKINLHNEIQHLVITSEIKSEVLLMLLYLSKGDYFHELYVEMDLQLEKIVSAQYSDQRGYEVSEDYYSAIVSAISDITSFSEGNALHPRYFNGYNVAIRKAIEGIVILLGLKNPISTKPTEIENYVVHLCLRYVDYETLTKLFIRNDIHSIPFSVSHGDDCNVALSYVDNLLSSYKEADQYCKQEIVVGNYIPNDILAGQIKISGILIAISDETDERVNSFTRLLLSLYKNDGYSTSEALIFAFREIILRRHMSVELDTLTECYEILLSIKDNDNYNLLIELPYLIVRQNPGYVNFNENIKNSIGERVNKIEMEVNDCNLLSAYWQIADQKLKNQISSSFIRSLEKKFDSNLCYSACLAQIITFEPFVVRFIKSLPTSENAKKVRKMFRSDNDFRQVGLTKFIHLAYVFSIDLKTPVIQALHQNISYYKWLLNLSDFDYSLFNPYWLILEPSQDFFVEFRKHPKITEAVEHVLKKQNIPRLSELYFRYLAR